MSGTTPLKDQLVHNNLAHKLLFCGAGDFTLHNETGFILEGGTDNVLVKVLKEGFSITTYGATYILENLPDEVLSHRERKIMKDMVRSPQTVKTVVTDPAFANRDQGLSLEGIF